MKATCFIILCSEYPPYMGGIALWAENLLKTLTANGHEAVVLTHLNRSHRKKGVKSTKLVRYIPGHDWQKFHWIYRLPTILKYLLTRKDVVLVAATWDDLQVVHNLKSLFRFRIYCASHGTDITKHVFPKKPKTITRIDRILGKVDLFMPVSSSLDRIARAMYPSLRCETLVLGCNVFTDIFIPVPDAARKQELRRQFGIDPHCRLLITVGRMVAVKGFRHVLMALPELRKSIPDIRYLIVADREEPECLLIDNLVRELHLEKHVIIQPPVKNDELPKLLQAADLFVLTSEPVYCPHYQEEGLPRVIPEASACGLPVVVSTTGGLAEAVVDGRTGFVIANGDQEALKKSMLTLLNDPELSAGMGRNGREHVLQHFSVDAMTRKILNLASKS